MFEQLINNDMSSVHFKYDKKTNLRAIIAIHNTCNGPALGGCRFLPYESTAYAINDAMLLARCMGYKAALAGLNLGGGKSVIIMPKNKYCRKALFNAFGQFVETLNGQYIAAMDSGTNTEDMNMIAQQTKHITCTSNEGGPEKYTAQGVFYGIKACLTASPNLPNSFKDLRVTVQGAGHVGYELCDLLHKAGSQILISDYDKDKVAHIVKNYNATFVSPNNIYSTPCDIFSPCALGGVLTPKTIPLLQCQGIAGSANNQLLTPECATIIQKRNILYAPDYLINSGGLIFASTSLHNWTKAQVLKKISMIYNTTLDIFNEQKITHESTNIITQRIANIRLNKVNA